MPRTVDSVRQVSVGDIWGDESPGSETEEFTLSSSEKHDVEVMVRNYPFKGQTILEGDFRFERPARVGEGDVATGKYQIRPESGLFILRKESGRLDPNDVANALRDNIEGNLEIQDSVILSREGLWKFIDSADSKMALEVLTPFGETKSVEELIEEEGLKYENIKGAYPIKRARVFFTPPFSENSVEVTYTNETVSVGSERDDHHEYVIQLLERDVIGGEEYDRE